MTKKTLEMTAKAKEVLEGNSKKAQQTTQRIFKKTMADEKKKDSKDYLRVDLKPTDGADLKAYVMEQAGKEGISATKYIQQIIETDMKKHRSGKLTKRQQVAELVEKVNDSDLKTIEEVLKRFV